MKVLNGKTIIYKDEQEFFNFSVFSILFIVTAGWVTGLLYDSFWDTKEDIILFIVLFIFAVVFFLLVVNEIRDITDTYNERPLVVIDESGIRLFDTPFIFWKDIEKVVLIRDFDTKNFILHMKDKNKKNYGLNNMYVSEFRELSKFLEILKQFFENVEHREGD